MGVGGGGGGLQERDTPLSWKVAACVALLLYFLLSMSAGEGRTGDQGEREGGGEGGVLSVS